MALHKSFIHSFFHSFIEDLLHIVSIVQVLTQTQETELEVVKRLQRAEEEKQLSKEMIAVLQRTLVDSERNAAALQRGLVEAEAVQRETQISTAVLQQNLAEVEAERRETERSAHRLQKDKSALKKSLNKVVAFILQCFFVF